MIWGCTLQPGQSYTEQLSEEVHLSLAALESRLEDVDNKSYSQVVLATEEAEQLLCTLVHGVLFQQCLDLKLMPDEKVTFKVQGSSTVYITGYTVKTPRMLYYSDNVQDAEFTESVNYDVGIEEEFEEDLDVCETVSEQEDIVIKAEMGEMADVTDTAEQSQDSRETGMTPYKGLTSLQNPESTASHHHQPPNNVLPMAVQHNGRDQQLLSKMTLSKSTRAMELSIIKTAHPGMQSSNHSTNRQSSDNNQRLSGTPTDDGLRQFQGKSGGSFQLIDNHMRGSLTGRKAKRWSSSGLNQSTQREPAVEVNSASFHEPVDTPLGEDRLSSSYHGLHQSAASSRRYQDDMTENTVTMIVRRHPDGSVQADSLVSVPAEMGLERDLSGAYPTTSSQWTYDAICRDHGSLQLVPSTSSPMIPVSYKSSRVKDSHTVRASKKHVTKDDTSSINQTPHTPVSELFKFHRSTKSFMCRFCNKNFHRARSQQLHERTHTGDKPFKCLYCRKEFADRSNKIKHERIHTGVKPFKCEHCGNAYSDPSAKRRHQESCIKRTANSQERENVS
ncbi:uncharacterized protein [Apostichopus japonicus]|uniref:uncharacterized protein n=1 Tax=Stichopus japonicus TaxID=307972 RepID=UPI003AB54DFB